MRVALLVLLTTAAPAWADGVRLNDKAHPPEEYSGVTPGSPQPAEGKPRHPPTKGTLSWIGFEAKDGGAQVFFQSPGEFEVTQRVSGGELIVHLSLPHLGHNEWRDIDTRYFDNPLSSIRARAVGARGKTPAGIDVTIRFKNPRDARVAAIRLNTEADKMFYAYLTFPEGAEKP
ncbi:MAG TPA: hypothetical protein VGM88_27375 [Kofleriaceae bacterium]|jgi:hypothetical protein